MKFYKKALKYGAALAAFGAAGSASAASLIPAGTLTGMATDLTDTFAESIGFAYPIMLVFVGGVVGFQLIKRMIKMGAKA